jgi:hypothetical protein
MRSLLISLGLLAALPLCADDAVGRWNLDVHTYKGTLDGHYLGVDSGEPFQVDLKNDLGLVRDKSKTGFGLEYQGHRFGLEVSMDGQDYVGSNTINRAVTINGQTFNVGAKITSTVKSTTTVVNWTIRALSFDYVWLGVDLGARGVSLDLKAAGYEPFTSYSATAAYKIDYPVPQIGVSAGFNAFGGRVVGRGYYHFPKYSGASYIVTGADLRIFPISWLGIRAFTTTAKLNVPRGSINKDIDITLDQSGSGFGVVLRF